MDNIAEGLAEEGDNKTQLQEMLDFFYSKQPQMEGAAEDDYEALEMEVEKLSSRIDDLRHSRVQKKNQLNLLYNKYELMASELQLFLLDQEDKGILDLSVLPTTLLVLEKERDNLLEERRRLEEDLMKNLMADRRKKVTKEDLKNFKKQFKDTVAFYDIVGFKRSNDNKHLREHEDLWKRLLFQYHQLGQKALEIQSTLESSTEGNRHLKDELQFINQKMATIEHRISSSKDKLDSNSSELRAIFKDLGISLDRPLNKGYHKTQEELQYLLENTNPDLRKVGLAYANYQLGRDMQWAKTHDHSEIYVTLYSSIKSIIERTVGEFDTDKEKFESVHDEYLQSMNILCKLNTVDSYFVRLFNRDECQRLVAELFQYFNACDEAVKEANIA